MFIVETGIALHFCKSPVFSVSRIRRFLTSGSVIPLEGCSHLFPCDGKATVQGGHVVRGREAELIAAPRNCCEVREWQNEPGRETAVPRHLPFRFTEFKFENGVGT